MTSSPTGLRLTTPRNPVTADERTWSIQNPSLTVSNEVATLSWTTIPGERYRVESSTDFTAWQPAATGLLAPTNELSVPVPAVSAKQFFRLARER